MLFKFKNEIDLKETNGTFIVVTFFTGTFLEIIIHKTQSSIHPFCMMRNLSKYACKVKDGQQEKTCFENHSLIY